LFSKNLKLNVPAVFIRKLKVPPPIPVTGGVVVPFK
jgi:hypothetical protein